jgi:hypothetical protein
VIASHPKALSPVAAAPVETDSFCSSDIGEVYEEILAEDSLLTALSTDRVEPRQPDPELQTTTKKTYTAELHSRAQSAAS